MPSAIERVDFAPPAPPGRLWAFVLAGLAHGVLALALTLGVQWKREADTLAVEAQLWSSVPTEAAPREAPTPPPPVQAAPEPPEAPPVREADITLQTQRQLQAQRHEQLLREQQERERRQVQQRRAEERKKADEEKKAQERKRVDEQKRRQQDDQRRLNQQREENLRRMQGLAGATGNPDATGTAQASAGPSASWAGRVRARVKPNIIFSDDVPGNPEAVVEVRLSPDGTIVNKRIAKSSGVPAWDDAVLRALEKTEVLPRDVDGRVHSPVSLVFRRRD